MGGISLLEREERLLHFSFGGTEVTFGCGADLGHFDADEDSTVGGIGVGDGFFDEGGDAVAAFGRVAVAHDADVVSEVEEVAGGVFGDAIEGDGIGWGAVWE